MKTETPSSGALAVFTIHLSDALCVDQEPDNRCNTLRAVVMQCESYNLYVPLRWRM